MILRGTIAPFELVFQRPFLAGGVKTYSRRGWRVELHDSTGAVGVGEASPWLPQEFQLCEASLHACLKAVRGLSTDRDSFNTLPLRGVPSSIFAVETAWLDLQSKLLGLPCRKTLNLAAPAVVAVNGLVDQSDEPELDRAAADFTRQGYTAVKIKLGRPDFRDDLRVARRLRALLPNVIFRGDANGAWSPGDALSRLEALAPLGFEYIEEPISGADYAVWRQLQTRSPIAIAIDESLRDSNDVKRCAAEGAADRWILKPQRLGGFRATFDALKVARSCDIPVTITGMFESAIGTTALLHATAAWLPAHSIAGLQTQGWFRNDTAALPVFQGGCFHLGSEPGLGFESPHQIRHAG